MSVLRQLGLAARFLSGHLVQLTSDVPALDGPSGPAASAPITGATGICTTTMEFSNTVTRIHEDPRVTLPYTEASWSAIVDLGARVDARPAAGDVRLTVGGEPTFVSIDNQVDPEWTTAAAGPDKRRRAGALTARLTATLAPHALTQRGQGKWYPGEPLPRWQIGLVWRTDGEPLWHDDTLLADPWAEHRDPESVEPAADPDAARALLAALAEDLGLPQTQVRPAYEDGLARLAALVRAPDGGSPAGLDGLATLYEQARRSRLSTESFDIDGTHGGTGGGNHITLGGRTPADSPFLRRPDLLVSMLTYWQRHPALSYLFAGRFVGTPSQAPRVDEGRASALYELEIAFAEIARLGEEGAAPAWVTDRALRHLLADITDLREKLARQSTDTAPPGILDLRRVRTVLR